MKPVLSIIFFFVFFYPLMHLTKGPVITNDFLEKAPYFRVLGIKNESYRMLYLSDALDNTEDYTFHIDQDVALNGDDVQHIKILEEKNQRQKIAFYYNDIHRSISIYEVKDNKVKPVQYQMTSHIGLSFVYIVIFFISILLARLTSKLVIALWYKNKNASSALKEQSEEK